MCDCDALKSSDSLDVHEDFIGLYSIDNTESQTLVKVIKDVLLRMNLSAQNIRGQCYDGVSVMKGHRAGVAKVISDLEPRAVYTHCFGHSMNLAVCDSVRACLTLKNTLEIVREITKLIKFSPRREAILGEVKEEQNSKAVGIRVLCPT